MDPSAAFDLAVAREFWAGKRVLVTGHTGFKGSWLTLWLSELGAEVGGFSLEPHTEPSLFEALALRDRCDHRIGDLRDPTAVEAALKAFQPEVVIHMAAQAVVRRSYRDPLETVHVNVAGTANLLDACRRQTSLRAILNVTSDKCYRNREWHYAYRETDRLGGQDVYSVSKACAELLGEAFRASFFGDENGSSVALSSARSGNVIGGGDWSADRLIPDAVRAFHGGRELVVRSPDAVRPWQHVVEPLTGYLMLARACFEHGDKFAAAWNFGPAPSQVLKVGMLAEAVAEAWGEGAAWRCQSRSDGLHEARLLLVDSALARAELGWESMLKVEEAVEATIAWYRAFYDGARGRDLCDFTLRQITHLRAAAERPAAGRGS